MPNMVPGEAGAEASEQTGALLATLAGPGVVALSDRRIPGSGAGIDHIAISAAGVFVIGTGCFDDEVSTRPGAPLWKRAPRRLLVGNHDCSDLVTGVSQQAAVVRGALWDVPVRPALCLVDAIWTKAEPLDIGDVWVGWPSALIQLVTGPPSAAPVQVERVARRIATRFPPGAGSLRAWY